MRLVVGLGNPGSEYAGTRHNVGFMVADGIQEAFGLPSFTKKFKGLASKGRVAGEDVVVLKPQTYMNLSGESVQAAMAFFKLKPADVLVIHDELDVAPGMLKFKVGGGDAGHNGLKSITQALGTPDYARLRFGIGRPVHKSQVSDYVLHAFDPEEGVMVAERVAWIVENFGKLMAEPHAALAKLKNV